MYASSSAGNHPEEPAWKPWRRFDAIELPLATRRWLLAEGSLTAQLQAASGNRLRVRVLSQQWRRPRQAERRALGLATHEVALVREVILECAGEPWVFARSVLPAATLSGRLRHLRRFGERSLGALLFATRGLRRQPFELARVGTPHRIVPATIEAFGGVDILVNNAAWGRWQPAHQQRPRDLRLAWEINVVTPLHLAQRCLDSMKARGGGWVVNLSSATSNLPHPAPYDFSERYIGYNLAMGPSVYASTKAALERLSAGLAVELAPHGIAVNTLAPVEAVASEGALEAGVIDDIAHFEPVEAMAEAALALSTRPATELSGRIVLSLELLRELGQHSVSTLDGSATLPDYRF